MEFDLRTYSEPFPQYWGGVSINNGHTDTVWSSCMVGLSSVKDPVKWALGRSHPRSRFQYRNPVGSGVLIAGDQGQLLELRLCHQHPVKRVLMQPR